MIYYVPPDYIDDFPNMISIHKHIADGGETVKIYNNLESFIEAFNNEDISDLGMLYTENNTKPLICLGKEDLYRNGYTEDIDETTFDEIAYNLGENLASYLDDELVEICEGMGIEKREKIRVSDCCGAYETNEDTCSICGEICNFIEE